ncbi:MAG: PH domain-containing protein [Patescibacteria group bacterium]|nr:PH domain-containing protein [Patescibacteria group bacterium]
MIDINKEIHLGEKAYLLMVSRKILPGLAIMIIAAILLALSGVITGVLAGLVTAAGANQAKAVISISGYMTDVTLGLLILGLMICLVGAIIARLQYSNYSYMFEEFDLRMKRGILFRHIDSLPYRQIQDVNIDRSLVHQMLGLSKITILTAGHEEEGEKGEAQVVLDLLGKEDAEEIRQELERKIGVQIVKTVQEADAESSTGKGTGAARQ